MRTVTEAATVAMLLLALVLAADGPGIARRRRAWAVLAWIILGALEVSLCAALVLGH